MLAYSDSMRSLSSADDEESQQGPACEARQLFELLEHMHVGAATEAPRKPAVQQTGASPASLVKLAPEEAAFTEDLAATLICTMTAGPLQTKSKGQLRPAGQPTSAIEAASASANLVLKPTNVWHKLQNMSQPVQLTDSITKGSTASSPAWSPKPARENSRKGAAGIRGGQKHVAQSQVPKVPPGQSTKYNDGTKTSAHSRKEPMQLSGGMPNAEAGWSPQFSAAVAAASGRLGSAPGCRPAAPGAHRGRASADGAHTPVRSVDARELPFKCEKASLVAANARQRSAGQQSPAPRQPACPPPDSSQCQLTEQPPSCTVPLSLSQAWKAAALGREGDPEEGIAGEPGLNIADPVIDDILADIPEQDWPSYLNFIKRVAAMPSPRGTGQLASDDAAQPVSAATGKPARAVACADMNAANHLITRPRLSPPNHSAYQEPYVSEASAGPAVTAGTTPQGEPQQSSSQPQAASTAWRTAEERREPLQKPIAAAAELHTERAARLSEQPGERPGNCGGEQPGSPHESRMLSLQGAIDRLRQVQTCGDTRLLAGDARILKDDVLDAVAKELLQEQRSGTPAAVNGENVSQEASLAMLAGTDVSSLDCPGRVSQQDAGTAADTDL